MDEATNPPPLKLDPRYGYYPHWPQDGDGWLHPEDVALARSEFPSRRIWRREGSAGEYHAIHYGQLTLRVQSALWQEVPKPRFEMGDLVEVRTRMIKNDPHTGRVIEVLWDDSKAQIVYQIEENDKPIPNTYSTEDLTPVEPPAPRESSRIEANTPEATEGVDALVEGLPVDDDFKEFGA